jgi:4-hydroxybenzoate polyprenyltransferase
LEIKALQLLNELGRDKTSVTKYLKLARITAWPAFSLTFTIPYAVGTNDETSWPRALIGFSSLLLFAGFAFALNFYADRDTDRYHDGIQKDFNLGQQPLVTVEVTEQECKVFCLVTLMVTVALGFLVSNLFGLFVILACLAGGILYSHPRIRLKAKPVGDILCISLLGILAPSAGYILGAGVRPTLLMMLFWFLVTATGYMATVVSDYEFDAKANLRTSAVFFGQSGLLKAMTVTCVLSLIAAFFVFRSHFYPPGTRYFAAVSGAVLVVFTAQVWRSLKPPKMHVPIISSRKRWVFAAQGIIAPGIISLLFLSYAFIKLFAPDSLPMDPFHVL